jgi:TolB-like protein/Tfp pilus assembly protein PilF
LAELSIKLLGDCSFLDPEGRDVSLPTRKARALLAYLALAPNQWHNRERLAGLLWSDRKERLARHSLTQALGSIRKLGEALTTDLVETEGDRVRMSSLAVNLDVTTFRELITTDPSAASALYSGPLLDGFSVPDPAFEEWLTTERARLHSEACRAFETAATQAARDGDTARAIELSRRLLALDSYREASYRLLMGLHASAGDRAEAIRLYKMCERLLHDELGVAPAAETTALLEQIKLGDGRAMSLAKTAPSPAAPDEESSPLPDRPSIAVLPFDNLSGDPEQDYFADGMAEDIITALSRFRWLFTVARNSTFTYKGRPVDVRRVARELNVRYVLEGSIRKGGNRIRVAAQLIDASTGNHIWAERYDRQLDDLFALQDEITETLVGAIAPEIDHAERQRADRLTPDSIDSWLMFQKGLSAYYETTEESLERAVNIFDDICHRDTGFAQAHAMAGDTRLRQAMHFERNRTRELVDEARECARRAKELDNRDALGFCVDARALSMYGDHEGAMRLAEQGIALNPNSWMTHHSLGFVLIVGGRFEAGLESLDTAERFSPHSAFSAGTLSMRAGALIALRRFDEAARIGELGIEAAHPRPSTFIYLAAAHAYLGQVDRARTTLKELRERHPNSAQPDLTRERTNTGALSWEAVGEILADGLRLCLE